MIPKYHFMTLGKCLHLADPTAEDQNSLLWKVCPLLTQLEWKFANRTLLGKIPQLTRVLRNLMGGFHSSSTCQWSLINLASKFGFLLTLTPIMFHAFKSTWVTTEENSSGHFLGKLEGRKKPCAMCTKAGRKRNEGCTFETSYACEQCGVPLCCQMQGEQLCFAKWHSGNL